MDIIFGPRADSAYSTSKLSRMYSWKSDACTNPGEFQKRKSLTSGVYGTTRWRFEATSTK